MRSTRKNVEEPTQIQEQVKGDQRRGRRKVELLRVAGEGICSTKQLRRRIDGILRRYGKDGFIGNDRDREFMMKAIGLHEEHSKWRTIGIQGVGTTRVQYPRRGQYSCFQVMLNDGTQVSFAPFMVHWDAEGRVRLFEQAMMNDYWWWPKEGLLRCARAWMDAKGLEVLDIPIEKTAHGAQLGDPEQLRSWQEFCKAWEGGAAA
jgi:hypothetical protein